MKARGDHPPKVGAGSYRESRRIKLCESVNPYKAVLRQDFHAPVDQVAGTIHNHWGLTLPPDDPEVSVDCPQCGQATWRYSQHCVHCRLDLFAWRDAQHRARMRRKTFKVGIAMAGTGLGAMGVGQLLPDVMQFYVGFGGLVCAGLGVAALNNSERYR